MSQITHHKVVSALPSVLDADAVYYVRVGSGFDMYVTNSNGTVVAYEVNKPTRATLGVNNVDNTSDADKPVSIATQTALSAKQDKSDLLTNLSLEVTKADRLIYATGPNYFAQTPFTHFARQFNAATDAISGRNVLGLGTYATASMVDTPAINLMPDSGRFAAKTHPQSLGASGTFVASEFLATYNGSTTTNAGKFSHNNSTFGGAAPALTTSIQELLVAMGRTADDARYGIEFYVSKITAGTGTSVAMVDGGVTRYLLTSNGSKALYQSGDWATFVGWMRIRGGSARFNATLYKNGVSTTWGTTITEEEGWVHVRAAQQQKRGYNFGFPGIHVTPGSVVELACVGFFNGFVDVGLHKAPLAAAAGYTNVAVADIDGLQAALNGKLSTTGGKITGQLEISGDILPDADNVRSLGSPTLMWKDVFIGPGSLYLNGQKILEDTEAGTIRMTADAGQNISIQTKTTGDIELAPQGTGVIQMKGPVTFNAGSPLRSSNGSAIVLDDSLRFNIGEGVVGGLTVDGVNVSLEGHSHTFASLTSKPTTLSGYGITDALSSSDTAAAATKLADARTINGVAFDGTANITIADATKEAAITAGTTAQYWRGDKTFQDLGTAVRAANLAGLSLATNTSVAATDTILAALGKLQAQVNARLLATANAVSATKLQTARTISVAGDATGSLTFDGTANVSMDVTLQPSGVSAGTFTKVTVDSKGRVTTGASLLATDVPTLNQSTTGNAATATKLQTARTITLTGGVAGSASFDGSANVSINAQVADDSHTHSLGNLGLGNAAKRAVQTSPTDATAGALMAVGAFGLGANTPEWPKTTLNDFTVPTGFYRAPSSVTDTPWADYWGVAIEKAPDGAYVRQSIWCLNTETRIFERAISNGVAVPWREIWHTGNLVKQTSPTDTTAGALMAVGAFGVGGSLGMPDANLPPMGGGFYEHVFTENSTTHTGYPRLGDGHIRHWNTIAFGPESRKTEIASEVFGVGTQRARTFIRIKHDYDWSAWRELYTQASILGAVSQSGGVPTGAIIERGSNANGQFVKYADGTLICWQKTNGGGANWFDWIYPAGFVSTPVFTATINPGGNSANVFTTQASSSAAAASIRKKFMSNAGGAWVTPLASR